MPRALLVNPWVHDFAAYDFWMRPLGLLEVGGALRAAGWDVSMLDLVSPYFPGREDPLPIRRQDGSGKLDQEEIPKPGALRRVPRRFKRYGIRPAAAEGLCRSLPAPDAILVGSVMTYWYTGVAESVSLLRMMFPAAPVALGGVYATLLPEHALSATGVDVVCEGPFQRSLPLALASLGLPVPEFGDSSPAWDLCHQVNGAAVITSRGCPFGCPYCASRFLSPAFRRLDTDRILAELTDLARRLSVTDVAFYDDALRGGGDDHLRSILEGALDRGLGLRFHAVNALHLRGMSGDLARLMKRADVRTLRFGLETADPARRDLLGGKADMDDLRGAVESLRSAGYESGEIGVYLLAGLPGQSPSEVEESVEQTLAAGARPYLTEYSPVPRSRMWDDAVAASRFDLESEPLFHNNTLMSCAGADFGFETIDRLKRKTREPFRPAR